VSAGVADTREHHVDGEEQQSRAAPSPPVHHLPTCRAPAGRRPRGLEGRGLATLALTAPRRVRRGAVLGLGLSRLFVRAPSSPATCRVLRTCPDLPSTRSCPQSRASHFSLLPAFPPPSGPAGVKGQGCRRLPTRCSSGGGRLAGTRLRAERARFTARSRATCADDRVHMHRTDTRMWGWAAGARSSRASGRTCCSTCRTPRRRLPPLPTCCHAATRPSQHSCRCLNPKP
jgi:hypothetical protein